MLRIKQFFALIVVVLGLASCASTSDKPQDHIGEISQAQLNKRFLIFNKNYKAFALTKEQIDVVKALPKDLSVDIYFGTWCHDSEREVPRMLKALTHNSSVSINLIALDYQKQDPKGEAIKAGIKFTPTFVIKQKGQEIGRIIERPQIDLIADLAKFVG
ncbi:thioredoxin [Thalassotalea sp. M1531]|uniref:Thioredoxin n=1 Tax=Thalassotalea algicola TaxID=2716224 RepID=A0A7Y0LAC3_9GAMM|nr:thioredoxin family protein [Thalassotalea algicola]NMP30894.1 thioredoxin [Thalassotalea algicola]